MVLEYAFVQLMEKIGGKTGEDVGMGKIAPERIMYCAQSEDLEAILGFCCQSPMTVCIKQSDYLLSVAMSALLMRSELFRQDLSYWTSIFLTAGDQALLRVVRGICSKNGEDIANLAVSISHCCSRHFCSDHCVKNGAYTSMKCLVASE